MAQCKKIYRQIKRVCIGSLNELIKIKVRSITPPVGGSVFYGEDFQNIMDVWAMIETKNGLVTFDSTNTAQNVTHQFYIRYISDVTFENWLEYKGKYYNILTVNNLNEENRFYMLQCNERGSKDIEVNLS